MKLNKHLIQGEKGKTVCYTVPDLTFDESRHTIQWGAFRFYTPEGNLEDNEGFRFFNVPADSVSVVRDEDLDKNLLIMATRENGVAALELYAGADHDPIILGLEGDIFISAHIPALREAEIVIDYKEVTNG